MSDLLSRTRSGASKTSSGDPRRPLASAAAIAALAAVAWSLLICIAVALLGWYLADAGAHGQPTGALRVAADAWLMAHGSTLDAAGVPLGMMPLGLTALVLVVGFRAGRRAARAAQRVTDDRQLGQAVLVGCLTYLVATIVVALVAGRGNADPNIPQAMLGALLVDVAGLGSGLAAGSGRLALRWQQVPGYLRSAGEGALTGALVLVAAASVAVGVSLALHFDDAANLVSGLGLSFGDALMLLAASVLLVPNAVLLGVSYLAGPGFGVGVGTQVTAGSVLLGPIPAFPLLAALPGTGTQPGWLEALYAVPPIAAAIGAGLAQRRYAVVAWDSTALRAFGSGLGAGALTWLLVDLAGGPMGTGRMSEIGAPMGALFVTAIGGMGLGGLVGGLAVAAVQRRRGVTPPEPTPAPDSDSDSDSDAELTEDLGAWHGRGFDA